MNKSEYDNWVWKNQKETTEYGGQRERDKWVWGSQKNTTKYAQIRRKQVSVEKSKKGKPISVLNHVQKTRVGECLTFTLRLQHSSISACVHFGSYTWQTISLVRLRLVGPPGALLTTLLVGSRLVARWAFIWNTHIIHVKHNPTQEQPDYKGSCLSEIHTLYVNIYNPQQEQLDLMGRNMSRIHTYT